MDLSTAFIDTIKNDKSKILRAFIREDIKIPLADRLQGVSKGVSAKVAKEFSEIKEDGGEKTFNNAKSEVIESAMALAQDLQSARDRASKEGIKETFSKATGHVITVGDVLTGITKRYRRAFDVFINGIKSELDDSKAEEEKIFYILKVLLYCTSFLIGLYLGRSLPDKDITRFGIGKHRSALAHSVIPAIFIKLLATLMFRLVDAVYAKIGDGEDGKETLALIKRNLGVMAGGMSVGVASQLLQEGFFNSSGVIGGIDLNMITEDTGLDDPAFLVVNAFFSSLFGGGVVGSLNHDGEKSAA